VISATASLASPTTYPHMTGTLQPPLSAAPPSVQHRLQSNPADICGEALTSGSTACDFFRSGTACRPAPGSSRHLPTITNDNAWCTTAAVHPADLQHQNAPPVESVHTDPPVPGCFHCGSASQHTIHQQTVAWAPAGAATVTAAKSLSTTTRPLPPLASHVVGNALSLPLRHSPTDSPHLHAAEGTDCPSSHTLSSHSGLHCVNVIPRTTTWAGSQLLIAESAQQADANNGTKDGVLAAEGLKCQGESACSSSDARSPLSRPPEVHTLRPCHTHSADKGSSDLEPGEQLQPRNGSHTPTGSRPSGTPVNAALPCLQVQALQVAVDALWTRVEEAGATLQGLPSHLPSPYSTPTRLPGQSMSRLCSLSQTPTPQSPPQFQPSSEAPLDTASGGHLAALSNPRSAHYATQSAGRCTHLTGMPSNDSHEQALNLERSVHCERGSGSASEATGQAHMEMQNAEVAEGATDREYSLSQDLQLAPSGHASDALCPSSHPTPHCPPRAPSSFTELHAGPETCLAHEHGNHASLRSSHSTRASELSRSGSLTMNIDVAKVHLLSALTAHAALVSPSHDSQAPAPCADAPRPALSPRTALADPVQSADPHVPASQQSGNSPAPAADVLGAARQPVAGTLCRVLSSESPVLAPQPPVDTTSHANSPSAVGLHSPKLASSGEQSPALKTLSLEADMDLLALLLDTPSSASSMPEQDLGSEDRSCSGRMTEEVASVLSRVTHPEYALSMFSEVEQPDQAAAIASVKVQPEKMLPLTSGGSALESPSGLSRPGASSPAGTDNNLPAASLGEAQPVPSLELSSSGPPDLLGHLSASTLLESLHPSANIEHANLSPAVDDPSQCHLDDTPSELTMCASWPGNAQPDTLAACHPHESEVGLFSTGIPIRGPALPFLSLDCALPGTPPTVTPNGSGALALADSRPSEAHAALQPSSRGVPHAALKAKEIWSSPVEALPLRTVNLSEAAPAVEQLLVPSLAGATSSSPIVHFGCALGLPDAVEVPARVLQPAAEDPTCSEAGAAVPAETVPRLVDDGNAQDTSRAQADNAMQDGSSQDTSSSALVAAPEVSLDCGSILNQAGPSIGSECRPAPAEVFLVDCSMSEAEPTAQGPVPTAAKGLCVLEKEDGMQERAVGTANLGAAVNTADGLAPMGATGLETAGEVSFCVEGGRRSDYCPKDVRSTKPCAFMPAPACLLCVKLG
jgi:hypothetical protein